MDVSLYPEDLLDAHKDTPRTEVRFEHFNADAQAVVRSQAKRRSTPIGPRRLDTKASTRPRAEINP